VLRSPRGICISCYPLLHRFERPSPALTSNEISTPKPTKRIWWCPSKASKSPTTGASHRPISRSHRIESRPRGGLWVIFSYAASPASKHRVIEGRMHATSTATSYSPTHASNPQRIVRAHPGGVQVAFTNPRKTTATMLGVEIARRPVDFVLVFEAWRWEVACWKWPTGSYQGIGEWIGPCGVWKVRIVLQGVIAWWRLSRVAGCRVIGFAGLFGGGWLRACFFVACLLETGHELLNDVKTQERAEIAETAEGDKDGLDDVRCISRGCGRRHGCRGKRRFRDEIFGHYVKRGGFVVTYAYPVYYRPAT